MSKLDEIDLASLSFDELVALNDKINLAIWNSKEWQEVTVPQGDWIVGEDIPAGKWVIKCADVDRSSYLTEKSEIRWGPLPEEGIIRTLGVSEGGKKTIYNPEHENYKKGMVKQAIVELKEGITFRVRDYAPVTFSPYTGKPKLGFK